MLKFRKRLQIIYIVIKNITAFEYFKTATEKVLSKIYYCIEYKIFEKLLPKENIVCNEDYNGYSFLIFNIDNINLLRTVAWSNLIKKFKNNLYNGNICFVVYYKEEIAGYSWIDFEYAEERASVRYKLNEKEAYFFGSYVLPKFRNKGIYSFMCKKTISFLTERGYKKVRALANNIFAQKAFRKLGFIMTGRIIYFNFFGFKKYCTYKNLI